MSEKKVLFDLGSSLRITLQESGGNGRLVIARGEFGRADIPTQNKRIYPSKLWKREIQKIQEAIKAGKVMGHLNHPCLTSDDFRILTLDGWKDFRDVQAGDRVWSLKDGRAVISEVEAIIDEPYSGDAYEVVGRNINATFTGAHKFVLSQRSDRNLTGEIYATIEQIAENREKYTHNPIPKTAVFDRPKTDFVVIPASIEANPNRTKNDVSKDLVLDAKLFAAFMGIYLSEGCTSSEKSDTWNIHISQKNEWSRKYIYDEILSHFPDELKWTEEKTGFHLADARLYRFLKTLGDQYSRYVPKEVKALDADCLKELLFWFMIGDGRLVQVGSDGRSKYPLEQTVKSCLSERVREGSVPSGISRDVFSVSQRLIQDLHECLVLSGGSGSVTVIEPCGDYEYAGRLIKAENKSPLFQLHISTVSGTYITKKVKIDRIHHDGNIYCIRATHGNFYMERKGKSFWTGNSDGKTDLTKISHIMTGLEMTDDGVIIGEARILDNEHGNQLRAILSAGGAVGVSSRGLGSTAMSESGVEVVQDDFSYMTHDFVADPAVLTSYPKFQTEMRWIDSGAVMTENKEKEDKMAKAKVKVEDIEKVEEPGAEQSPLVQLDAIEAAVEALLASDKEEDIKKLEKISVSIGKLALKLAPKEEPKEEPKEDGEAVLPADLPPAEVKAESNEIVASIILEDIKKLMASSKTEDVTAKDLEIKKLKENFEKVASVANRLGVQLHLKTVMEERSSEERKEVSELLGEMNQYQTVQSLDKALKEANSVIKKRKLQESARQEEINKAKAHLESQIQEQSKRIGELENALKESVVLNKTLAIQQYVESRVIDHPNAATVRKLCEGKISKDEVDQVIKSHTIAPVVSEDYNSVRRRFDRYRNTTLVENQLKETLPKQQAPKVVAEGVDQEMANLFPGAELGTVKALM